MKCNQGHTMTEKVGTTTIEEHGVRIALRDVRIFKCAQCGIETPAIPKMESLFREAAIAIAKMPNRLGPHEIRFLRKSLGLSSRDFAKKMGVDHTTVSKWERADDPQDMGPIAQRLLRMFVLTERPVEEYPLEEMGTVEAKAPPLVMVHDKAGWHPRAA